MSKCNNNYSNLELATHDADLRTVGDGVVDGAVVNGDSHDSSRCRGVLMICFVIMK